MHHIETERGDMVPWPVTYLDAYDGWVRELPVRDDLGWYVKQLV